MKTVIVNVSNDRSSAVDRVALIPDQNTVVVRLKNSGHWYEKKIDQTLMHLVAERFRGEYGSFGKFAHFHGLFSDMTPVSLLSKVLA